MSAIQLIVDDAFAEIRLNNPSKLNALTFSMLRQLEEHCATIEMSKTIRVVLLTGEGDRAFCVGADINEWSELSPGDFARDWVREGHRIIDRLAHLRVPTIAVLNAHAFGGGLELAIACDLRVMAPDATLGLPEPSVGIVPGWSGTQRLQRLLPEPVIKEMALFGRRLSAQRAYEFGLVAEVSKTPMSTAREIANSMLQNAPAATEIAKYMIHAGAGENTSALIETLGGGMIAATDDKNEGVAAFCEKRTPDFKGS